jgi:hypothetical protein
MSRAGERAPTFRGPVDMSFLSISGHRSVSPIFFSKKSGDNNSGAEHSFAMAKKLAQKIEEIARKVGRSVPTIYRWHQSGLDLDNEVQVKEWAETKRHRAHGAALAQARNEEGGNGSEKQEQETEVIDIEDIVAEGSDPAATYRRVQELEKVLYKRGIRALREGKQSQISIRLADYQRVLEMVRKLSAGVAALERDADKLVPRETAETIAAISPRVFRLGIMSWFSQTHGFTDGLPSR